MSKVLVFDMDGTIADLYGVKGWLDSLHAEDAQPYEVARPLYDMVLLQALLLALKSLGWRIVVTSWLARGASADYDAKVRAAKRGWLARYGFPYDEIHLVKYGTTKADCTRRHGGFQILVDDNADIRKGWNLGDTIDASHDIIGALIDLIEGEI